MIDYEVRDMTLQSMGYPSYTAYLSSPLWKTIRTTVFKNFNGECLICHSPGEHVHHMSYDREVLLGHDLMELVVLCSTCHNLAEFNADGSKRSVADANARIGVLKRSRKRGEKYYKSGTPYWKKTPYFRARKAQLKREKSLATGKCHECGLPSRKGKMYCRPCDIKRLRSGSPRSW